MLGHDANGAGPVGATSSTAPPSSGAPSGVLVSETMDVQVYSVEVDTTGTITSALITIPAAATNPNGAVSVGPVAMDLSVPGKATFSTPLSAGSYAAATITLNGTIVVSGTQPITVIELSGGGGGGSGGGGGGGTPPATDAITGITISPTSKQLAGNGVATFVGTVLGTGTFSPAITWSATGGSIVNGVFTAPPATDNNQVIVVTATATGNTAKKANATVTVLGLVPPDTTHNAKTVALTILAHDQQGNPISGAYITAVLDKVDIDQVSGFISPEEVTLEADSYGVATLNLWPNALGNMESSYIITIENPDTQSAMAFKAVLPDNDCFLHQIATPLS